MEDRTLLSAGDLDPTFGTGGKVVTDFGAGSINTVDAVTLQPDGKIIVVGKTQATASSRSLFAIARYNSDGTLDGGFGRGGKVSTDFDPLPAEAIAVHVQPDSKIMVVGEGGNTASSVNVLFSRYNADGTLDMAFGAGGKVVDTVSLTSGFPDVGGAAWQTDGKIVVAAGVYVLRYNADGTRDQTFGSDGSVQVTLTDVEAIAVQPDGKIVAAIQRTYLGRLNPDGSPDPTFGRGGGLTLFANGDSIVPQPDGRILTMSLAPISPERFNVNGTRDNTFSADQIEIDAISAPFRLALQADGRVLLAMTGHGATFSGSFLLRYNPDGSRDTRFGNNGMVTTDVIAGLAIQADGRIVAAGTVLTGTSSNLGVARYLSDDPIADPTERYVSQVYLDLLQRPVDPSGLAASAAFLKQGNSRARLIQVIEDSPEYHALVVGYLFGYVFARPVDDSGRYSWVGFLNQGGTAEQLEAFLLGSAEYFTGTFTRPLGNGTNDAFLVELYGDVLHRVIDPAGLQGWRQALANGAPRSAVAAAVLASLESDAMEVQSLYSRFLRRSADSGGLDAFTSSLQNGVANEEVIAALLGSDEYFSLVLRLP